jgi:hypothetical protein
MVNILNFVWVIAQKERKKIIVACIGSKLRFTAPQLRLQNVNPFLYSKDKSRWLEPERRRNAFTERDSASSFHCSKAWLLRESFCFRSLISANC